MALTFCAWEKEFVERMSYWRAVCERHASRRYRAFLSDGDFVDLVNDTFNDVWKKLHKNCREKPADQELSDAYVMNMVRSIMRDVYRERQGRHRPRVWLRKLGPVGERLFDLVCLGKMTAQDIFAMLDERRDEVLDLYNVPREIIARIVNQIQVVLECAQTEREKVPIDEDGRLVAERDGEHKPADSLRARTLPISLLLILEHLFDQLSLGGREHGSITLAEFEARLADVPRDRFWGGEPLSAEQMFILRCRIMDVDDLTAARELGWVARALEEDRDKVVRKLERRAGNDEAIAETRDESIRQGAENRAVRQLRYQRKLAIERVQELIDGFDLLPG